MQESSCARTRLTVWKSHDDDFLRKSLVVGPLTAATVQYARRKDHGRR